MFSLGVRSVVLPNHAILVDYEQISIFDTFKLFFEFVNVLLLCSFNLSHYFLLCVELPIEVFSFRQAFIHLMLELQILFLKQLNLLQGSRHFDFSTLNIELGVLQLTPYSQKFILSLHVFFLFLIKTFNPHVSSFPFTSQNVIQAVDFVLELLFL